MHVNARRTLWWLYPQISKREVPEMMSYLQLLFSFHHRRQGHSQRRFVHLNKMQMGLLAIREVFDDM